MLTLGIGSVSRSRVAAVLLLLAMLVTGCLPPPRPAPPPAPPPPPPAKVEPAKPAKPAGPPVIALLLPLSGEHAAVGRDMLDAAQMALFQVGDNRTVLLPRDTGGTPEGAVAALRTAIGEGARFVVGPLLAASTRAAAPLAKQAGIPLISFSNDSAVAATGAYVFGFRPEEQVLRVMDYASRQGLRRVALLASDDAYGRRVVSAWTDGLARFGLDPTSPRQILGPTESELDAAVRRISAYDARREALQQQIAALRQRTDEVARAALARLETQDTFGPPPFDALLVAEGGPRLRSVAALLAYYDVSPPNVRFLGTSRWLEETPEIFKIETLHGSWLADRDPDKAAEFAREFVQLFDREPSPLAVLAFDATALALVLARGEKPFDPAELTAPAGFAGYGGLVRLRPDGLAEHGLAVLEITPEGPRVIEPAPARFPPTFAGAGQTISAVSSQNRVIASTAR